MLGPPVPSSTNPPPSPGVFLGGAVCIAIGVEFLVRNNAVGPQRRLPGFRQDLSLQFLVTEVCGVLVQDMSLGKCLMWDGKGKVAAGQWGIQHII